MIVERRAQRGLADLAHRVARQLADEVDRAWALVHRQLTGDEVRELPVAGVAVGEIGRHDEGGDALPEIVIG